MCKSHLSAIIVDNDASSNDLLKNYIQSTQNIELVGSFHSIHDALNFSYDFTPEIMYIDIHMSGLREYQYLSAISPKVCKHLIITSYESKYAIDGYHNNVYDYLMKPLSYDRFAESLNKLLTIRFPAENVDTLEPNREETPGAVGMINYNMNNEEYIWIKCDKRIYRMWKPDIKFVEALKDYIIIHYKDKKYITHLSMSTIEMYLGNKDFIRVNRSYIIAINSIISIYGNVIETTFNKEIPIGIRYRDKIKLLYTGF
ncbi:LytR/AlgR family response regulator transcription factor [Chitinophaga flava]|uniref:DNA-binding response regulator n=1 Tax=Chitinophaga flava TaxID=2259036 RepID=A0A365XU40_9BACT|nr:response regulator transcription factor [Chitinophaga flava]RBL89638.1 hypothetical protein DF182_24365 [Chitinophaga flava]